MRAKRTIGIVVMTIASLALSTAPALARTSVDPSTLNPAPPDFFNAVCNEGAAGTICSLAFSDDPIVDEPSGIVCGSVELLFSQTRSVIGKRFYDANGNLVQRHFREEMAGTFTNPSTGKIAEWIQHDTVIQNLDVPGDLNSGTTKFTGLLTRIRMPGRGTLLTDAGTLVTDPATGETIRSGGNHPFSDYFSGQDPTALAPLCDALD